MASSSSLAQGPIVKRLHVSGLIPTITSDHLKDRFNSFGEVECVDELGLDGNGQPRSFAYLTLKTTPDQLKKCMNIMSGSKWRGATLRLAEAKRRYDEREAELNPSMEIMAKQARKLAQKNAKNRVRLGLGRESDSMKPVTLQRAEKRKFWNIDPGNSDSDSEVRTVRPLVFRPLHPIPKPDVPYVAPAATGTASQPVAKLTAKEQLKLKIKQARKDRRKAPPPSRAQRRVLDPLAYGSRYRVFAEDKSGQVVSGGEWVFVQEEDERAIGVWKHILDGDVVETERVLKPVANEVQADDESELDDISVDLEEDDVDIDELDEIFAARPSPVLARSASPLFATHASDAASEASSSSKVQPSRSSSPMFPLRAASRGASRSASPMFPVRTEAVAASSPVSKRSTSPSFPAASERSASPLFPVRTQARQRTATPPPTKKLAAAAPLDEALVALARQERLAGLGVFSGLFDDADDFEVASDVKKGKSEWRGFDESDSEDGSEGGVMRLRGGAAESESETESSEEESSEESSEEESSDGSSDEESPSEEESGEEEKAVAMDVDEVASSSAKPSKLKDMFAPRPEEASSFSLMQGLDVELDDDVPFAITTHAPAAVESAPELELLAPSAQAVFDPDPSIPLFFPVGTKLTGARGEAADPLAEAREPGFKPFHQQETDAEMTARWDEQKLELTREYKRRHRDAVKQRRRRQPGVDAGETFD